MGARRRVQNWTNAQLKEVITTCNRTATPKMLAEKFEVEPYTINNLIAKLRKQGARIPNKITDDEFIKQVQSMRKDPDLEGFFEDTSKKVPGKGK